MIPIDPDFDPETYMKVIHAMESGEPVQMVIPEGETYHVSIASMPIEMTFRFSVLEWHMLLGMISACSDHMAVGSAFVSQFQQGMVVWAKEAGRPAKPEGWTCYCGDSSDEHFKGETSHVNADSGTDNSVSTPDAKGSPSA